MIIHRAFYKEATVSTLATALVLALLVISQKAVVVLSSAAVGDIKAAWVVTLLLLDLILDFDLLMQLALFVGVLVTLNRWYRDSEMVVLTSCGVGIMNLVRPVMIFTLLFAIIVSVLVMIIRPTAFNRIQEVRQANADKADVSVLSTGQFNSLNGFTYFIEQSDSGSGRNNVFIHRQQQRRSETIVAERIKQIANPGSGQKFVQLESGSIFLGQPGDRDYQVTRFQLYELGLIGSRQRQAVDQVEGIPMSKLTAYENRERGLTELQTRLGKPVMLFIFAGIAMLLSYTSPRSSHYRSLFLAVLVFFFYLTVLQYVRDLMKAGQVSPVYSMWIVHGLAGFAIYRLLMRRSNGLSLLALPWKRGS